MLAEGPEAVDYGFQVPVEASHYFVGARGEWLAAGYSGSFQVDRKSLDIKRYAVESDELPPRTSGCEISSVLEFGSPQAAGAGWFVPAKSTAHDVLRDTTETDSVTAISDCLAPSPAPAAHPSSQGAPLRPGIALTLALNAPIDSGVAAAGDAISASITEAYFAGTQAVEFPRLKGATVSGRIVRVEHRMARHGDPPYFVISVAFDTLEANGVVSPFYARLFGLPKGVTRPLPRKMPGPGNRDWPGSFRFTNRNPRLVVEAPFYSKWLTTAPDAVY